MKTVHCVRCLEEREGLAAKPIPTALGDEVLANVCANCWKLWMETSTKVINEHRLQLFKPEHRKILEDQMRTFLNLPGGPTSGA
jgi:Fe-S cluster biosynthesis and repair protein YggX